MLIILQTQIVDEALKVSPYNALAYGFLVAVILSALIWVTRQWMKDKDFLQKFSTEFITLTTKMISTLDEDRKATADLYREIQEQQKLNASILADIKMELYKLRTEPRLPK